MIVDFEHHYYLTEAGSGAGGRPAKFERAWGTDGQMQLSLSDAGSRVERHLQFMDESGIDMAVLTGNAHGHSLENIQEWNNACAQLVKAHPNRFVGFAITQPLNTHGIRELERAVKDLGMKGVQIRTHVEGRNLDSPDLSPFYKKVCELGIPIDVHVTPAPSGFDALHAPYALHYNVAREFDMCATVLRICLGGVLERFPNLVFIMNHFGGGISSVKDRIDYYAAVCGRDFWQNSAQALPQTWTEYFDKLYFNMAGRGVGIATVKCALTNIHPNKLLFGTDWPANFENDSHSVRRYIQEIRELDLKQPEIDGMLGGNAQRLLGL